MKKGFYPAIYSTVAVAMVLAFVISVYNAGTVNDEVKEESLQVQTDENAGAAAVAKNDVKSYKEITTEKVTQQQTEATTATPAATAPKKETLKAEEPRYTLFDDSKEMSWPVEGQIVMDYSVDTAVYDKTLDQYRTNDSISISAAADTRVTAAADGVVESVSNDKVNGNRVVLNHGNGWRTTYSQLRDDVSVTEGQVVCQGDVIGRVGTPSPYSEALGTHLTFTVSRDENNIDPKTVLASIE